MGLSLNTAAAAENRIESAETKTVKLRAVKPKQ